MHINRRELIVRLEEHARLSEDIAKGKSPAALNAVGAEMLASDLRAAISLLSDEHWGVARPRPDTEQ